MPHGRTTTVRGLTNFAGDRGTKGPGGAESYPVP